MGVDILNHYDLLDKTAWALDRVTKQREGPETLRVLALRSVHQARRSRFVVFGLTAPATGHPILPKKSY